MSGHLRPREHLRHGQVLWTAVHRDHPPRYHQRIADSELVPVVLDLSVSEDIEARLARRRPAEILRRKAVRLCEQAYEQNGLLSNCDLAELLGVADSRIAAVLGRHGSGHGSRRRHEPDAQEDHLLEALCRRQGRSSDRPGDLPQHRIGGSVSRSVRSGSSLPPGGPRSHPDSPRVGLQRVAGPGVPGHRRRTGDKACLPQRESLRQCALSGERIGLCWRATRALVLMPVDGRGRLPTGRPRLPVHPLARKR